ncbi:cupin-like domain-containing protein [Marinagarivorans cellulosilyticus]|uniref:JmjC domain-containing protein n=1 Tax=Marinagarivorans cellulosilyticus TaxID=2721545 RepID=A0AAN2BM84_9GAMM|nr:cupin-like domain-containing protein [Marinagarivorans cellulosilyticus]BCD99903.1 hypothetical protein MARGE09_P4105 [Marinagarivorans cellulosilyticus]
MLDIKRKTKVVHGINPSTIPTEIIQLNEPVIIKQLVKDWPLVKASRKSDRAVIDYLNRFYNGRPTVVCKLKPEAKGRLFYDDSLSQLDYSSYRGRIDETLEAIYQGFQEDCPHDYYIASNIISTHLPRLRDENDIQVPRQVDDGVDPETVSIWLGSSTVASCHYDALDNIACCVAGKRRFTLFPPDQIDNLYPGPLEPTPGGQVVSLVDFDNPDFEQFPKFRDAINTAQVAELEPGDALFLPSMWWHHVQSLAPFNVLVNYWWNDAPRYMTSGMNALYAAMLGIRDKPKHEREAWKHVFDYYIFNGANNATSQIPSEAQGLLGNLDELSARKLRALLINKLNR